MNPANGDPPMKRITVRPKNPNPLFVKWLTEWRDESREKGTQFAYTCNKAIKTLKQYPTVLNSGKECGILKNFGSRLCVMLDRKLAEYRASNPLPDGPPPPDNPAPAATAAAPRRRVAAAAGADGSTTGATRGTKGAGRGGARGTTGTARPTKKRAAQNGQPSSSDSSQQDSMPSTSSDSTSRDVAITSNLSSPPIEIPAGCVQVKLIVDNCETSIGAVHASRKAALKELRAQNFPFEIRDLKVGDFLWVASYGSHDLVLPYIVERKRTDDLDKSIKGGRYHEQKMRLEACGLNVIYLIETLSNCRLSLPVETLFQAEVNTEINNKFCIHRTYSLKETISYLVTMTRTLQKKFKNKTLVSCNGDQGPDYSLLKDTMRLYPFKEFNDGSAKIENFTVREMFAQHLLQVSGASADAVCAIVEQYPTPALLRRAFGSSPEPARLLSTVQFGTLKRCVPPEVARKIWLFYTTHDFTTI